MEENELFPYLVVGLIGVVIGVILGAIQGCVDSSHVTDELMKCDKYKQLDINATLQYTSYSLYDIKCVPDLSKLDAKEKYLMEMIVNEE